MNFVLVYNDNMIDGTKYEFGVASFKNNFYQNF